MMVMIIVIKYNYTDNGDDRNNKKIIILITMITTLKNKW